MLLVIFSLLFLSTVSQAYTPPNGDNFLFFEPFPHSNIKQNGWVLSKKGQYSHESSVVSAYGGEGDFKHDLSLVLKDANQFYGLSKLFDQPISNEGEFVFQYEVKLEQGLTCGGAYVKLLRADDPTDITALDNNSPYTIMFGPDKCGTNSKVHFILQHQNPISGQWEEKHCIDPPAPKTDKLTHLYTLVIRKDNTFEIFIDQKSEKKGNLLDDMNPPINPPKYIDDPTDQKPMDWVDQAKISDPKATKPDDWDEDAPEYILDTDAEKPEDWLDNEPEMIPDPKAIKPDDWDDDEDGEFEALLIPNPKCESSSGCGIWSQPMKKNPEYKGKWSAPLIDNPEYQGEWKPQQIENPHYFVSQNPSNFAPIKSVAIEVWTTIGGIRMDNFLIGRSLKETNEYASKTWQLKFDEEKEIEKAEKKKKSDEEREKKLAEGGVQNVLEVYLTDTSEFILSHLLPSVVSLLVLLFSLCYLCFGRSSSSKRGPMPLEEMSNEQIDTSATTNNNEEEESGGDDDDDDDDDDDEEEESDDEQKEPNEQEQQPKEQGKQQEKQQPKKQQEKQQPKKQQPKKHEQQSEKKEEPKKHEQQPKKKEEPKNQKKKEEHQKKTEQKHESKKQEHKARQDNNAIGQHDDHELDDDENEWKTIKKSNRTRRA